MRAALLHVLRACDSNVPFMCMTRVIIVRTCLFSCVDEYTDTVGCRDVGKYLQVTQNVYETSRLLVTIFISEVGGTIAAATTLTLFRSVVCVRRRLCVKNGQGEYGG